MWGNEDRKEFACLTVSVGLAGQDPKLCLRIRLPKIINMPS